MRENMASGLRTPFVPLTALHRVTDLHADLLQLATTATTHPPVASRVVRLAGYRIRLEVLAASHRVVLSHPVLADCVLTETLACTTDLAAIALPARHDWRCGPWIAAFTSTVDHGDHAIDAAIDEIHRCDTPDAALAVQFPGDRRAITALAITCDDSGTFNGWRTWHLYPGDEPHAARTVTTITDTTPLSESFSELRIEGTP